SLPPCVYFVFYPPGRHRDLPSFPTRRSSDLAAHDLLGDALVRGGELSGRARRKLSGLGLRRDLLLQARLERVVGILTLLLVGDLDRKSTRLNSSHVSISYAVFCLKKKNTTQQEYKEKLSVQKLLSFCQYFV